MNAYERLDAWRAAHVLVQLIYRATRSFPMEERFGLSSQLRRAAFSIAANIVAGSAKKGPELHYALRLVRDLDLLTEDEFQKLESIRSVD